jgi:DNA-binding GntR family transcriptional regulator
MIVREQMAVGERLVEERLAESLGLSRTPVREAMHRLEQEGLLLKRPRGGYQVRPLSAAEVEEAVGVRAVLEAYAAELAARRATPKQLKEMERNLELFAEALQKKDEARLLELNSRFHELVYQAADSRLLFRLLSELQDEVERISRSIMSNMAAGSWSTDDHRRLFEAIKTGQAAAAARAAQTHVERGGKWYLSQLRDHEESEQNQ